MINLKIIFTSLFLFSVLLSQAQIQTIFNTNPYWQGEIYMQDGSVKKGLVRVPHKSSVRKLAFKKTDTDKKKKIKVKDMVAVSFTSMDGKNIYLFEQTVALQHEKFKKSRPQLLMVYAKNPYVTFYIETQSYEVNQKTDEIQLIYRYVQRSDFPVTVYYIKREIDKAAHLLYANGLIKNFKKVAEKYMSEDPNLVERIANKELKFGKDTEEIIAAYLKTTESL